MQLCAGFAVLVELVKLCCEVCGKLAAFEEIGDIDPLEIALLGNVKSLGKVMPIVAQNTDYLVKRESVIFTLNALAVCVLCTVISTLGGSHFTQDIVGSSGRCFKVNFLFCKAVCGGVGYNQQRIVVEHFLKMRCKEKSVRGVSRKASADMVENSAFSHLQESFLCHFQRRIIICLL